MAFEIFWYQLEILQDLDRDRADFNATMDALSSISEEGLIISEAQCIKKELEQIGEIFSQQLLVASRFYDQLTDLHAQQTDFARKETLSCLNCVTDTSSIVAEENNVDTSRNELFDRARRRAMLFINDINDINDTKAELGRLSHTVTEAIRHVSCCVVYLNSPHDCH